MKVVSWNINSIRSSEDKFLSFLTDYSPDIVFVQELRSTSDQLSFFLRYVPGYKAIFNSSNRLGYAGTALYYKDSLDIQNLSLHKDSILGDDGRIISFELNNTIFLGVYIPNGNMSDDRQLYKMRYLNRLSDYISEFQKEGKSIVCCGDFNIAVDERDVYAPSLNKNHSGFLPEERLWAKSFLNSMVDTFRIFEKRSAFYTWWHLRDKERKENKGWRFDYIFVSKDLESKCISHKLLKDVYGSDHCPIILDISLS